MNPYRDAEFPPPGLGCALARLGFTSLHAAPRLVRSIWINGCFTPDKGGYAIEDYECVACGRKWVKRAGVEPYASPS
jgi:hypothetical protein